MSINIVYICNEYPPIKKTGGIGIFTKSLAESLASLDHNVFIIGLYRDYRRVSYEEINKVKVIRIPCSNGRLSAISNKLKIYRELKKITRETTIDVIECPDFEGHLSLVPKLSKKVITRLHGSHSYFQIEQKKLPSPSLKYLEKLQLFKSDKVVSVSKYTAKITASIFSLNEMPDVIYNSVNLENLLNYQKKSYTSEKKVLYFGTLTEKKGIYSLASAWKIFHEANNSWSLDVVGKDNIINGESSKLKMQKILDTAIDSVTFFDHADHEDLLSMFKNYDFCVLPSFSEAFALAPLESMAVGLPTIVSNTSSGPELINDGEDGWLCNPYNIQNMYETILKVASSSACYREEIAKNAQQKIFHYFNYEDFVNKNINYYIDS